ncbi:MAG: hypothetical protein WCG34_09095, partial [Leptolinea sp.]
IGPSMPFALVNDLHVGFALNKIYDQHAVSFEAPLWFFRAGGMVGGVIPKFKPGNPIDYKYLTAHFMGTTDQVLVAYYSYGTDCLRIAAPEDRLRTDLGNDEGMLVSLSNPIWIDPVPAVPVVPLASIFGPEPEHGWCYSFQKMELARQEQKWEEASRLADDAEARGLVAKNPMEYTPVILAYLNTGQPEKAVKASLAAQKMDATKTEYLCSLWNQNKTLATETLAQTKIALMCASSTSPEEKK